MKKLNVLFVLAALMFLASCGKKAEVSFLTDMVEMSPEGGSVEVELTSNGDWSVDQVSDWITVSPQSGNGYAKLTLTAVANTGEVARSGFVKVTTKDSSATLTVSQGAKSLYLRLTPQRIDCMREGGEFGVEVRSNVDWQLHELPSWITASATHGSNDGSFVLTIAPFLDESDEGRQAVVTVAGGEMEMHIEVNQSYESAYVFAVTPNELAFDYMGGTGALTIVSNLAWTATTGAEWIAIDPVSGNENTEQTIQVAENPNWTAREATIRFDYTYPDNSVGHYLVWVRQEAAPNPHFLTVSPSEIPFGKEGGSAEISIECDADWSVEVPSDWASLSATNGTGNATVVITVEKNNIVAPRSLNLAFVSGDLVSRVLVTQEPDDAPPMAEISPDTVFVASTGAVQTLSINSNTSWSLETDASWIMILSPTGSGSGNKDIIVDSNASTEPRIAQILVKHDGQVMDMAVVVQEGKQYILETDITLIQAHSEGGQYTINVTSNMNWTVDKGAAWLSYTPTSGFGNGQIVVTVEPMLSPRPRETEIHIIADNGTVVVITVSQKD